MLKKFIPHLSVNSIYDIDLDALEQQGIKGIITDLDNTLVGSKEPLATPVLINWLNQLKERGFKVVIVSNNDHPRVSTFALPLSVPFIHSARKPTNRAFRAAMELMGVTAKQTAVIGDQLLTDVLGGNRMGLLTILVLPISLQDEGVFTKFNRKIERRLKMNLRKKGYMPGEE